jgi:hypothetical protein
MSDLSAVPSLPADSVRALAPVFLSYRTSDGSDLATRLAWALRATGVPVWHDVTDLPPGDTTRRLHEALTAGLSGAVLIVTPGIANSAVVRDVELPGLLGLEHDTAFSFAIGSIIPGPAAGGGPTRDGLDYAAPDTLLGQSERTLQRFKQYPLFDQAGVTALARELAAQRMTAVRALGHDELLLDIQTRLDPRGTPPELPLAVRLPPPAPGQRLPPAEAWPPFAAFLADLPRLLAIAGARRLRITGSAHLSVAFALGAAVPTTSGWPVTVQDRTGLWGEQIGPPQNPQVTLEETDSPRGAPSGAPVAIFVDLAPEPPPGDTFDAHLDQCPGRYSRAMRLQPAHRGHIPAEAAGTVVADLAGRIRTCAAHAATHRVELFLRVPLPIAVLLGRLLNTLEITLYEWDDTGPAPRYAEVVAVASGRGGGPILASGSSAAGRHR